MLDPNLNPNKDANDLTPWQWMIKYNGKQMLFSFLFISIFIVMPWIGQWYIATAWIRWTITLSMIVLNFVSTILHPYLTWKSSYYNYKIWKENNEKGWYK